MREAGHAIEALCCELLIETGMRLGELLKLNSDQITIGTIENEDGTKEDIGALKLHKAQTKNNTSRSVLLPAAIAREIKAVIAAGKMPSKGQVLRKFKSAVERAGYTGNIVVHSLRHTRNTRLRKAGVSQKVRMEILGHTSDVVNNIYDHTDLSDQLEAAKKLQEYAGKRGQKAVVVEFPNRKSA
jgi:integrase